MKDTPMKPIVKREGEDWAQKTYCPACDTIIPEEDCQDDGESRCASCGQLLFWIF